MSFPLRLFAQGRDHLTTAQPDTPLSTALTIMTKNDYSQLPVVTSDGQLRGVLSERSIVRTQFQLGAAVNTLAGTVEQCCDDAVVLEADQDIFEALARLRDNAAVVVVDDEAPIGIITDYDTTGFFRGLFEGLIWARDIELTLREYIERAFPSQEMLTTALMRAFGPDRRDGQKPARVYEHLTLGEHIQLILTDENWPKFRGTLEPKEMFRGWMERVRTIRNNIVHVRGEADGAELDAMRRAYTWLRNRSKLPEAQPTQLEHVHGASTLSEARNGRSGRGKYSAIYNWLLLTRQDQTRMRTTFNDIGRLLGEELPPSAFTHRAWWANDSVGHVQSKAWLDAGWRVTDVDFETQQVTFERTEGER